MAKYMMALDQGTTSSRCILFDKQGKIMSMAQKEFTQIYPNPGWVEHNPMEIWSSQMAVAMEAMAMVGARAEDICGIGITNQRETAIVWDRQTGLPIYNAIVWQCRRTAAQIDVLSIDIDGYDYHVWDAVQDYRPRIVIIEYNPSIPNDIIAINPHREDIFTGSSAAALVELGRKKGYSLIAVTQTNLLFVVNEEYDKLEIWDNEF